MLHLNEGIGTASTSSVGKLVEDVNCPFKCLCYYRGHTNASQIEFRFASCHVDSCGVVALTDTSISVGLIYLSSLHECPKNLLNCSRNLSSKLTTALSFRRVLKPLFLPFPPIKALRPLMIQLIIPCFSCGMAYVPTVVQSHSDEHSLAIFYLRALSRSQN